MTSIDHVMVRDDAWLPAGPDQAWKTLSSETAQKKSRQSGDSAPSPGSRDFDTQGTEPADFDTIPLNQTLTEQPEYGVHDLAGEGRFAVILLSNRTSQIVPCDRRQNNLGFSRRMGFTRKSIHAERSVKLEAHRGFGAISDAERM